MHDVFVNYRTGDGDEAAAMVENALSNRFGTDAVFRAAKSVPPGELFEDRLLIAVRRSSVLLAIIGPDWTRYPELRDPEDWVRREILEAKACGTRIVPVLKGRKTDRLNVADLPMELAHLANVQSLRLDVRDNGADLGQIGDMIADLIPWLTDHDRDPASDAGSAADHPAPSGDRTVRSTVSRVRGPVHAGIGDLNNDVQHFHGDGAAYVRGDNHGGIGHRFGAASGDKDES
ncbi:MAG TPA: TIR domain-containing protein [Streptosporangiaceae bacterium]|jgi:hypothetical protein